MIYVSTKEAAQLCGVSMRAIQKQVREGRLPAIREDRSVLIPLTGLPEEAQVAYVKVARKKLDAEGLKGLMPAAQAAARATNVELGLATLSQKSDSKSRRNTAILEMAQGCPSQSSKQAWYTGIADRFNISIQTVYRVVSEASDAADAKDSSDSRTLISWDPEALAFMQGYYLKAIREVGDCSRVTAYRVLIEEAKIKGWQIGSRSSAYEHLKNMPEILETYARGGNRALDNHFYILRDLDALDPFQIVVGDQHIFDWWVTDDEGNVFRPQCYLWLDMCTRMVYGIAFDRKYSSGTVKESLYMGLKRFGMFSCTYNDNGKPELSKVINETFADLSLYGMNNADVIDLYKSDDGYVVTDDDDNVVSVAGSPEEWEKQNRRIFAQVKNAKAKPIERAFRTFEQMLDDEALPGKVKALSLSAAEEEQAALRLKQQEGKLMHQSEFVVAVINMLEKYEKNTHSALKMSPRDKLMEKVHGGWSPTYINERELDFIFMTRARRKVNRSRILIEGVSFIGDDIKLSPTGDIDQDTGIHGFEGKYLEVRYDPNNLEKAYAITPKREIRPLYMSKKYQMLDEDDANEALAWKRRQMKVVREAYKRLTADIKGIVIETEAAKKLKEVSQKQRVEQPKIELKELQEQLSKRRDEQKTQEKNISKFRPHVWESDHKRYGWCLDAAIQGYELTDTDRRFMERYDSKMDEGERKYWETFKRLGGNA